ncbi:DUF3306 domain-containing protein [Ramlibacter humi]|uniref:DUF3306 domain-containing protein n=1 Tax=Ramlibacter humi TaxID=2530451 RepID=UPI001981D196|nr:DUF3306 domain-containing protein [Ramlibacter humi]
MADGFLGRWSKRKLDVKEGRAVEAEPPPSPQPSPAGGRGGEDGRAPPQRGEGGDEEAPAQDPPPTLEDVKSLTPDSDFTRFTRAGVAPQVKNAALKKLFADPRFNLQDGLDVYIDDYNKPDPLPEAMLRQLAGAKFLKLFGEEATEQEQGAGTRDGADAQPGASVAQSYAPADIPPPTALPDDAHPDLRLQQDDAAEGGEPGRGAG